MVPQELFEIIDAGKDYAGGHPPATITIGDKSAPNFQDEPAYTMLGREQKAWLKERLTRSTATWKIWGATNGTLDMRTDPQDLPAGLAKDEWPGKDFGTFGGGDFSGATASVPNYNTVRDHKLSGLVIISDDRHSFWAGYAAPKLPPAGFDPVGLSFITGSISAPGLPSGRILEGLPAASAICAQDAGCRARSDDQPDGQARRAAALEYSASGDITKARAATNPDVRRTWNSSTWRDTAMPWSLPALMRSIPNSSASSARSRVRPPPTAVRWLPCIASGKAVAAGQAAEAGAAGA